MLIMKERRALTYVDATLAYHSDEGFAESFIYTDKEAPPGLPMFSGRPDPREVRVWNGWLNADRLSLDVEGFAIASLPTSFTDWFEHDAVVRDYYPECLVAACTVTGASRGVIFDHNVRSGSKSREGFWSQTVARPTRGVHNDYTDRSAQTRAEEILGATPAERYAFVNLWRPILEPLRDSPLAVCDGRTLQQNDASLTELRYAERSGWIHRFRYNPRHRWTYFPEMLRDEVLFLKCWDSARDGRTRFSAHGAFDDPTTPADAPPRESIEARALLVWDESVEARLESSDADAT